MKIGMIGLGRMGGNMSERLLRHDHEVVGYDVDPERSAVPSIEALVDALEPPRAVWVMVPAGRPTTATVEELSELLSEGDTVIDGGNSKFTDSIRHGAQLLERGIGFIDAGVSGGIWGLENGYCLMVGGDEEVVNRIQPIFDALAPEGGFAHLGPVGSGHFTKMIHNGVEYALMEAYGEGYELLQASELGIDVDAAINVWRHGSVVRSWLLDLLCEALKDSPNLMDIKGWAADSGEGRWTVQTAVDLGVPAPAIAASLFSRFVSQRDDSPAMKVVAALRNQFGGHAVKSLGPG